MVNMRVNKDAKDSLKELKETVGYSTYSSTLKEMCNFFFRNKITPKDTLDSNFFSVLSMLKETLLKEIIDIKKFVKTDSQSMRKLLRALERDHLVSLSTKVSFLTDQERERNLKSLAENTFNVSAEINKITKEKQKSEEILFIEEQAQAISALDKNLLKQDLIIHKYEINFKKILNLYKIEKNTFGKQKVVIDMEREAFEELFNFD